MTPSTIPARATRLLASLLLGLSLAILSAGVFSPTSAEAQSEEELQNQKNYWQTRYRTLLQNRELLKQNIAKSRKNYAQAQRRNYPRGGAREQYRLDADAAEKELADVEKEIAGIFVEARSAGALPRWLSEVEDEPIVLPESAPAASANGTPAEDDGRNPLYRKQGSDQGR